jgi:hypothetical protein
LEQSVLPDGETQFHQVPVSALRLLQSAHRFTFEHSISLTVSPFSDPTSFSVSICMRHDHIPGTDDEVSVATLEISRTTLLAVTTDLVERVCPEQDGKSPAFTEISPRVSIPIFHRTTSALRPSAPTTKA